MPKAIERLTVPVSSQSLWGFIKEMPNWAPCMPGFVALDLKDENVSVWRLKGDVGIFQRTVNFTVTVTERVEPTSIAFTLEAKNDGIVGEGTYKAVAVGPDATEVEFTLSMSGRGIAGRVVDALLAKTLPRDCKSLALNIVNALGASAPQGPVV